MYMDAGRSFASSAWKVQLPGEEKPRSRALKPEGSRTATTDRATAQEIAFALWQNAVRAETEKRIKERQAAKEQQLKAKLRERAQALEELMEKAKTKAKAEAAARAKLEAELKLLRKKGQPMASCECCRAQSPENDLRRIDSGQRLCPACRQALEKEKLRQEAKRRFLCPT
jgi:ElaB/YqjD/DUF883 family membrane-anchored ribosome-binding protein